MGHKYCLNSGLIRLVFFDQLLQTGEYDTQALGKLTVTRLDSTIIDGCNTVTVNFDDTHTGHP